MGEILCMRVLEEALISGLNNLINHQGELNALNIFPVADRDTGTNLAMTFDAAREDLVRNIGDGDKKKYRRIVRRIMCSSRGNSGAIFTVILREVFTVMEQAEVIDTDACLAAFAAGTQRACRAVMEPVDGTILSCAEKALRITRAYRTSHPGLDVARTWNYLVRQMRRQVRETPLKNPFLKEEGVQDSGALAFLFFLEGMESAFEGKEVPLDEAPGDFSNVYVFMRENISGEHRMQPLVTYILHTESAESGTEAVSDTRRILERNCTQVVAFKRKGTIFTKSSTEQPLKALSQLGRAFLLKRCFAQAHTGLSKITMKKPDLDPPERKGGRYLVELVFIKVMADGRKEEDDRHPLSGDVQVVKAENEDVVRFFAGVDDLSSLERGCSAGLCLSELSVTVREER